MNTPLPSVALSGLPVVSSPKEAIAAVASMGSRAIQLDAARTGLRPRELDRSARRDLGASMRRAELEFSGLDLWIPSHHFVDPEKSDRAIGATVAALELAAELAGLAGGAAIVAVMLPGELLDSERTALDASAAGFGAVLADHAWPEVEAGIQGGIRPGLDSAAVIMAGDDPVASAGRGFAAARVSDLSARGPCVPGDPSGRLELDGYLIAMGVAGTAKHAVIDPRGLAEPELGVRATLERWPAGFTLPG